MIRKMLREALRRIFAIRSSQATTTNSIIAFQNHNGFEENIEETLLGRLTSFNHTINGVSKPPTMNHYSVACRTASKPRRQLSSHRSSREGESRRRSKEYTTKQIEM
jgi:hypothetical protein